MLLIAITASAAQNTQNDFQSIRSSDTNICLPAIERLGHSHNFAAVSVLGTAYGREKRAVVRRYIVESLGYLRDSAGTPALTQALSDADAQVRQSAVLALEQVGGDPAESALEAQIAREKDFATKIRLVGAFKRSNHPHADAALKQLSADGDRSVQASAEQALTKRHEKRPRTKGAE